MNLIIVVGQFSFKVFICKGCKSLFSCLEVTLLSNKSGFVKQYLKITSGSRSPIFKDYSPEINVFNLSSNKMLLLYMSHHLKATGDLHVTRSPQM